MPRKGSKKQKLDSGDDIPKSKENSAAGSSSKDITDYGSTTTILYLPSEILTNIIQYLPISQWPSLERVNRNFQESTFQTWRLVRKIHINNDLMIKHGKDFEEEVQLLNSLLEKLTLRAPNIMSLSGFSAFNKTSILPNGESAYDKALITKSSVDLLIQFSNLKEISFAGCRIKLASLGIFLSSSASREKLKSLKVVETLNPFEDIVEPHEAVIDGWQHLKLEELVLNDDDNLGECHFLSHIDASGLTTLDILNADSSSPLIDLLTKRCVNLKRLAFSFACHKYSSLGEDLTEYFEKNKEFLKSVAALPNLISLTLNIYPTGRCCSCLLHFHAEFEQMINDLCRRGLKELLVLDPQLRLNGCILSISPDNIRDLTSLSLRVDRCGYDRLMNLIMSMHSLEKLCLRGEDPIRFKGHEINQVEDDHFLSCLVNNATGLKYLRLDLICQEFSPKALKKLAKLSNLQELFFYGTNVRDKVLKAWSNGFGDQLTSLEIPDCENGVTDKGILPIVKKSRRLRRLDISRADITDRVLEAIAASCKDLRHSNISDCEQITLDGVLGIVVSCSHLKTLIADGLNRIWIPAD